jgi:hypothetical protein
LCTYTVLKATRRRATDAAARETCGVTLIAVVRRHWR